MGADLINITNLKDQITMPTDPDAPSFLQHKSADTHKATPLNMKPEYKPKQVAGF